ncbi:glycosyltransferase family 2 protein [Novosphingobium sp. CECT 9465]|uniref:glycosyltransferase family 2 protein n=1 Tax=Novosphingobium sp. CECT 9465 TaxID=2829794 RepID=UPI001E3E9164|nr:glycosyltransferase family 2 protein [Novosphingobium sp. CECT 9465]CAH0497928.1 N-acetylglucosaminyl-diphospho-decaprenol L-rhamnosyltransferase [Novosphingobium sp. CECT 9465]
MTAFEATGAQDHEVTVIMVSYNTRELTLTALETLFANAGNVSMRVVVWDNASHDGSADAVAAHFPGVELIRSDDNVGFAKANNVIAASAESEWLLLLNPDTETHPGAIENILRFGKANPRAGIVGGRTVFPDGSLNIASCWNTMSVWSLFCSATGLSRLFSNTTFFNPEGIGGWKRDTVRQVDVVVGCFLLIRTELWKQLDGFNPRYFMYGEEHDLCLRAARLGYRPMITPDAQIMHLVGASSSKREDKVLRLMRSKATLIRDHWGSVRAPLGIGLLWLWICTRRIGSGAFALVSGKRGQQSHWRKIWQERHEWLKGY